MFKHEIDNCTLIRGDAAKVLEALLPDAGAIVTDPPYGIGLKNNDRDGHRRKASYRITGDDDDSPVLRVLSIAESARLATIAFASPWRPWPGKWRNLIVWDKGLAVGGGGDIGTCLKRNWELIQVARNPKMNGPRIGSVWKFPMSPRDSDEHIAAKPVGLLVSLIQRFTAGTIVDPFMGSGSTGVAAIRAGRPFIGVEIEPHHFKTACDRIREEYRANKEAA